jgi:site-specific DNA recombinase
MTRRCAIYTRKSTERGLDQAFNSLSAQREACEAYIKVQAHEGWVLINSSYDDGGFSGGSVERPAFQRLLEDIEAGLIDVVVVSKVDRFTRSLTDFARIMDVLDARGTSFVAVTQQFNTTTSMGRLTLNMLLSFAQFEREVIGERIREKVLASRRKGLWMGGTPPLGYSAQGGKLQAEQSEVKVVREVFRTYLKLRDVGEVVAQLRARSVTGKSWTSRRGIHHPARPMSRGAVNHVLANPLYIGTVVHRGIGYRGQHDAIISRQIWDRTQSLLKRNRRRNAARRTITPKSFLSGRLYDELGRRMVVSITCKSTGKRYRYYQSVPREKSDTRIARASAGAVESAVIQAVLLGQSRAFVRQFDGLSQQLKERGIRALLKRAMVTETDAYIMFAGDCGIEQEVIVPFRRNSYPVTKIVRSLDSAKTQISTTNSSLLRTLAIANHWREALEKGRAESLRDIARSEKLPLSEVKALIRLAFLSPALIEKALDGRLPPALTQAELVKLAAEPCWQAAVPTA